MSSGIYWIKNLVNHHIYVGSSLDIGKRWNNHRRCLRDKKKKYHAEHLRNAFIKYGESNFEFSILEKCGKDKLLEREQFYIDNLKPEYNSCKIAGSPIGIKWSKESRRKLSEKKKGLKMGEENPNAKIDFAIASEIRNIYAIKKCTHSFLAKRFGLSLITVYRVLKNKIWKDDNYVAVCGTKRNGGGNAKVSFEIASEIRKRFVPRICQRKELAKEYGISIPTVDLILKNKIWKEEAI
jgi:group I intron endonuclease